jgi:hypothetical protein
VPKVLAELSDELGGIHRVIVNAGPGRCAAGDGQAVGQQGEIETNVVAALVQLETAL